MKAQKLKDDRIARTCSNETGMLDDNADSNDELMLCKPKITNNTDNNRGIVMNSIILDDIDGDLSDDSLDESAVDLFGLGDSSFVMDDLDVDADEDDIGDQFGLFDSNGEMRGCISDSEDVSKEVDCVIAASSPCLSVLSPSSQHTNTFTHNNHDDSHHVGQPTATHVTSPPSLPVCQLLSLPNAFVSSLSLRDRGMVTSMQQLTRMLQAVQSMMEAPNTDQRVTRLTPSSITLLFGSSLSSVKEAIVLQLPQVLQSRPVSVLRTSTLINAVRNAGPELFTTSPQDSVDGVDGVDDVVCVSPVQVYDDTVHSLLNELRATMEMLHSPTQLTDTSAGSNASSLTAKLIRNVAVATQDLHAPSKPYKGLSMMVGGYSNGGNDDGTGSDTDMRIDLDAVSTQMATVGARKVDRTLSVKQVPCIVNLQTKRTVTETLASKVEGILRETDISLLCGDGVGDGVPYICLKCSNNGAVIMPQPMSLTQTMSSYPSGRMAALAHQLWRYITQTQLTKQQPPNPPDLDTDMNVLSPRSTRVLNPISSRMYPILNQFFLPSSKSLPWCGQSKGYVDAASVSGWRLDARTDRIIGEIDNRKIHNNVKPAKSTGTKVKRTMKPSYSFAPSKPSPKPTDGLKSKTDVHSNDDAELHILQPNTQHNTDSVEVANVGGGGGGYINADHSSVCVMCNTTPGAPSSLTMLSTLPPTLRFAYLMQKSHAQLQELVDRRLQLPGNVSDSNLDSADRVIVEGIDAVISSTNDLVSTDHQQHVYYSFTKWIKPIKMT